MALLIILLAAMQTLAQADSGAVMAQANAAYQQGDYETAARLYQSLVDGGIQNSSVYFNLGSAYYESGELGRALLNYRRAQALLPRDNDLNRSLARIRGERTDIQGDETGLLEGLAALTGGVLTLAELGWLALLLWFGWFALLLGWMLGADWRETLRVPLIVGAVLVAVAVALLASRLWVQAYRPAAVVLAEQVDVMSGPGERYLSLFLLHAAAEIRIVERRGSWLRFALPDGRQGWLPEAVVEPV
ncbi:MAG: tetratricopeptide repeat protein [Chloroflexi bacterium]|nr:tetratricopeptide repeat protein [Chloroflexota bacterium]